MNKKFLTVYIFFISFSFCGNGFFIEDSKNSFFVNDWHDFTVLDKKGKYTKVKGKLIYQDPGNEEITITAIDSAEASGSMTFTVTVE